MRIAIRVDASAQMGAGHLMRCLTLADAVAARGATVAFLTRASAGPLIDTVRTRGHDVVVFSDGATGNTAADSEGTAHAAWLPVPQTEDARQTIAALHGDRTGGSAPDPVDWLIVDHYALDERWERTLRPACRRLMVIDDLADRRHDCDLLLDQNLVANLETRYDGLVPNGCARLLGPMYALLRPEFAAARKTLRKRDGTVRRILVSFGGSDASNETGKALEAIAALNRPDIAIDVVVGALSPHVEAVRAQVAATPAARLHVQAANMAELMAQADLAIGAGGSMTWERCALGLPSVVMALADNQRPTLTYLGSMMAQLDLGYASRTTSTELSAALTVLLYSPTATVALARTTGGLTDGRGMGRVLATLGLEYSCIALRRATEDDSQRLLDWRNHPSTRGASLTQHVISDGEHRAWFTRTLADPASLVLIAQHGNEPIGVVRFRVRDAEANVSISVAPEYQGRGFGEDMLRGGERCLKKTHPMVRTIVAEILPDNVASQRIFSAAGFHTDKLCYRRTVPS